MDIEKLQKELVEKISLILVEADNVTLGEEALEIINKLKNHINDDVVVENNGNERFTALDYVIIADSRGDNFKLSERPRINNRTLKELENAIRDIGGKTSEELGRVENVNDQEEPWTQFRDLISALRLLGDEIRRLDEPGHIEEEQRHLEEIRRRLLEDEQRNLEHRRERGVILASFALLLCSFSLADQLRNINDEEFSMISFVFISGLTLITGMVAYAMCSERRQPVERQADTNLEHTGVELGVERRQLSLD